LFNSPTDSNTTKTSQYFQFLKDEHGNFIQIGIDTAITSSFQHPLPLCADSFALYNLNQPENNRQFLSRPKNIKRRPEKTELNLEVEEAKKGPSKPHCMEKGCEVFCNNIPDLRKHLRESHSSVFKETSEEFPDLKSA